MNEHAIMHEPESKYCFAIDEKTVCLRLRVSKTDIPTKVEVIFGEKYTFSHKQEVKEMVRDSEDRLYAYYTAYITLSDKRFVYVFRIENNGKSSYFSEDGLTEKYDFTMNYYNCFQYAYINAIDIVKPIEWLQNAVFYQVFIDRFNIGKKDKDMSYVNLKWGDLPNPKSFAGGDIKGITEKLSYLKDLGINALYLTPIFKSISNHKYDISDYYQIDEHFGDMVDLKELISKAHSLGMKVVLDAVFNHASDELKEFQDVIKNGKESAYNDWFIITNDSPLEYECFGDCKYMPKFNTSNSQVRKYLIDIATYWIKECDIDGWRLDVSDEVSHTFWREFRTAVKNAKKDAVLIGENWHDANVYLRGDQFDSIMNYAFTKATLDYFAFNNFDEKAYAEKLNGLLMRNTDAVNIMMLNSLDTHDTHRFLTRVGGNARSLRKALATLFFFVGVPCIYYGTEIELEGGYDPDSRRTFDWNIGNTPTKELIKILSMLRHKQDFSEAKVEIKSLLDEIRISRIGKKETYVLTIGKNVIEIIANGKRFYYENEPLNNNAKKK